jgi:hypothetical protein
LSIGGGVTFPHLRGNPKENQMATTNQVSAAKNGGGRFLMSYPITLNMAAGATTTDSSLIIPGGSRVNSIKWQVGTNFTGTPTNIYLTVGKSAGAQDYVANTDVKSATALTSAALVNSTDLANWPSNQAAFVTLTANGGTTPAGTCYVMIDYSPVVV